MAFVQPGLEEDKASSIAAITHLHLPKMRGEGGGGGEEGEWSSFYGVLNGVLRFGVVAWLPARLSASSALALSLS
jgi:hypothetical protein